MGENKRKIMNKKKNLAEVVNKVEVAETKK